MKNKYLHQAGLIIFIGLITIVSTEAQILSDGKEIRYNPIFTAVPFLTITPDSRHSAMGNVGVATSPDANSQYLNPSKYAFAEEKFGISASYTPWLRKMVSDINLGCLSAYLKIGNNQSIGSSLRYFSMGDVHLTDQDGTNLGNVKPNEFAIDFSYSRKLSDYFSGGVAIRYIHTDLTGRYGQEIYSPGGAFASDVSFFYNKRWKRNAQDKTFSVGVNLSNIGSKISYNNGQTKQFLPANMRLGTTFTSNSLSFSFDINKLLVPTPAIKEISDNNGGIILLTDNSSKQSVMSAVFNSFTDAPGGLKEELQEICISTGIEYWVNNVFALRSGYFNEAQNKGNRKFFTAGAGVKMRICSIDFSYLIPINQNSPLANTMQFTIIVPRI